MNSKESLKQARELISLKQYQQAKDICLKLISVEPLNYNAHVFLGLSEQNLNNRIASNDAYQKAIELNPSLPLAHQGLVALHESSDQLEYANALLGLRSLYSRSDTKYIEITKKLIVAYKHQSQLCLNAYLDLIHMEETTELWISITTLQIDIDSTFIKDEFEKRRTRLDAGTTNQIKQALKLEVIKSSGVKKYYDKWIHTSNDLIHLFNYFLVLTERLGNELKTNNSTILECKNLVERIVGLHGMNDPIFHFCLDYLQNKDVKNVDIPFEYMRKYLLQLEDDRLKSLVESLLLIMMEDSEQDLNLILENIETYTESLQTPIIWLMITRAEILFRLEEYDRVIQSTRDIINHLSKEELKLGISLKESKANMLLLQARSFLKQNTLMLDTALTISKELDSQFPNNFDIKEILIYTLIQNNQIGEAYSTCQESKLAEVDALKIDLIIADIYMRQSKFKECEEKLLPFIKLHDTSDANMLLGKCYWMWDGRYLIHTFEKLSSIDDHSRNREFAYSSLLKAIKLNKSNAIAFEYLGLFYYQIDQDFQRALKCFQKSLSLQPSSELSAKNCVDLFLKLEMYHDAEVLLIDFTTSHPRSSWAWIKLGVLFSAKEQHSSAIIALQAALRLRPNSTVCLEILGSSYTIEGKYIAAIKCFERCIELDSGILVAFYGLGEVKYLLGLYDDAKTCFDTCLKIESAHLPSLEYLSLVWNGMADEAKNDGCLSLTGEYIVNSIKCLEEYCIEYGKDDGIYKLIGDSFVKLGLLNFELCYLDTFYNLSNKMTHHQHHTIVQSVFKSDEMDSSEDFSAKCFYFASAAYKIALSIGLENEIDKELIGSYWSGLSYCMFKLNPEKIEIPRQCITLAIFTDSTNPVFWNTLGLITAKVDIELSQHSFIKSLEYDSKSASTWCNLGFLYLSQNENSLARQAFESAKFVNPEHPMSWFGESFVVKRAGRTDYLTLIEQSYELDPSNTGEICYQFAIKLMNETQESAMDSDYTEAILCLTKYTAFHPKDTTCLNFLALMHESQKNISSSIQYLEDALRLLDPNSCEYYKVQQNIARCLCSESKYADAVDIYDKIGQPLTTLSILQRGVAHYFQEDFEKSFMYFDDAYNQAEHDKDVHLQNEISLTMGQAFYTLRHDEHIELAQQRLLQTYLTLLNQIIKYYSITLDSNFVKGILALCAIGLVLGNNHLSESALNEISKFSLEQKESEREHVYLIQSIYSLITGDLKQAKRFLTKSIHSKPFLKERWTNLSFYLKKRYESECHTVASSIEKCSHVFTSKSESDSTIELFDDGHDLKDGTITSRTDGSIITKT